MKSIVYLSLIVFACFVVQFCYSQNPDGFDKMAKNMAGTKTPTIHLDKLPVNVDKSALFMFLDSREKEEFETSHINGAIWVGYDNLEIEKIKSLNKSDTIIIYCSVGYRSGKTAEKLIDLGFTNVFNLYGGIFNWVNSGNEVVNKNGTTTQVHGYNQKWSKWLNADRCLPIIE
jgi:rhodanese-related sulfurtransferase